MKHVCVCVCVSVCLLSKKLCVCVCICVCVSFGGRLDHLLGQLGAYERAKGRFRVRSAAALKD